VAAGVDRRLYLETVSVLDAVPVNCLKSTSRCAAWPLGGSGPARYALPAATMMVRTTIAAEPWQFSTACAATPAPTSSLESHVSDGSGAGCQDSRSTCDVASTL